MSLIVYDKFEGYKNKPENNTNQTGIQFLAANDSIEEAPEFIAWKDRNKKYVSWGWDNRYPNRIFKIYEQSSEHAAIIKGLQQYVFGEGIDLTQLPEYFSNMNEDGENLNDILWKIILDQLLFNGFALNVIPTKKKGIYSTYYSEFENIRVDENLEYSYFSKTWSKWEKIKEIQETILFDYKKKDKMINEFLYYTGSDERCVYPRPDYMGSLNSILTSIQIQIYHLYGITNNFFPSLILNMNNGKPLPEEQRDFEDRFEKKFRGTKKTAKMVVTYNNDANSAPTLLRMTEDNLDKRFKELRTSVRDNIYEVHHIALPALFGVASNKTFSKTEFVEGFQVLNKTTIIKWQNLITSKLNKLYKIYFPEVDFNGMIKKFNINELLDNPVVEQQIEDIKNNK